MLDHPQIPGLAGDALIGIERAIIGEREPGSTDLGAKEPLGSRLRRGLTGKGNAAGQDTQRHPPSPGTHTASVLWKVRFQFQSLDVHW
jgi:hypothetical protein